MKKEEADKMTIQELVDYAMGKIVGQGGRSVNSGGNCCMISHFGRRRCVFSWMLDEEILLLMKFEYTVVEMVDRYSEHLPNVVIDNVELILILQRFHDSKHLHHRRICLKRISNFGVLDMDKPYWSQWVEMGQ